MDGFKKRLADSLQFRLLLRLTLVITLVAVVAGEFSFISAFNEARELQDNVLRQVATLYDQKQLSVSQTQRPAALGSTDEESQVVVQYLSSSTPLSLPRLLRDGIQTVDVDGEPYRLVVKTLGSGERIAVAQETGVRDDIARAGSIRTLTPFLILVPILLLVTADLVRKTFRPIADLSVGIDQRSEHDLHAFPSESLPVEIRPFVVAINRLLKRVAEASESQRLFVANAAHELRSPYTALSLQAERLADSDMSDIARERLSALRLGIERGRTLLVQLLSLAREQSVTTASQSDVSILQVYRRVLEDLLPLAEAKGIDIGVDGDTDAQILINESELVTLVRNLVDNAIRYTPYAGKIDLTVSTQAQKVILEVIDSGRGIPPEERRRVFEPFYRILGNDETGSGLGLSIVQTIANRIGGTVSLEYANVEAQTGLSVRVVLEA